MIYLVMLNSDSGKRFQFIVNLVMLLSIVISSLLPIFATISSPQEISNQLLQSGQRAYTIGYYDQALDKFNQAIEKNKTNYQAFAYRAAANLALGKIKSAYDDLLFAEPHLERDTFLINIKAQVLQNQYSSLTSTEIEELENLLDEMILLNPDNIDYRLWRGSYYFNKKDYQRTINDLSDLTSNSEALLFTGTSYFEMGKYDEAILALDKANHLSPNNISILQQLVVANFSTKEYSKAIAYQSTLISLSEPEAALFKDLGMMYILVDELDLAIQSYIKASLLAPLDEEIPFQLGVLSYQIDEYMEAVNYFSDALTVKNDWGDAYLNRATSYVALNNFENAYHDYTAAYTYFPDSIDILQKLSELELLLGNVDQAIQDYELLIQEFPENQEFLFTHAYLVTTYFIDQCSTVQWEFEKIIELDDTQTVPYHYLGLCSYSNNNRNIAYSYWEKALDGLPETLDSLYFLAYMDYEDGETEKSLERVSTLLEYDSTYAIGYFLKGNNLLEQELFEDAIENFSLAIDYEINLLISHFNRGVAHFNLGNLGAAEQDFLEAYELAKNENNQILVENIESAMKTLHEHPNWEG